LTGFEAIKNTCLTEAGSYTASVITRLEIEAAIEQLPSAEQTGLCERLLERMAIRPKTGAELAALWPISFHLTKQEADDFARDLEAAGQNPMRTLAREW
jgi:hypothetical protein